MMKLNLKFGIAFMLISGVALGQSSMKLEPSTQEFTISRHIYGHFAEHLGRCIYDGFYVGEKNDSIPHADGVRKDVIEALKKLNIPNLRWPGGCFADTYHWKDGIGPKAQRPTMVNNWWGGVTEDNSFGTHDFLNMCELLEAEPYLAGNVGSGEVQELADWVQYVNFSGKSPMSDWRRKNGRQEPWKVKFWGVGNESWGCGGNMTVNIDPKKTNKIRVDLGGLKASKVTGRILRADKLQDYNSFKVPTKIVPAAYSKAKVQNGLVDIEIPAFSVIVLELN